MKRRNLLQLGASIAAIPLLPRAARADGRAALERVITRIGSNHGHVLTVSLADVKAGGEKTYDLTGSSGHAHSATLKPDDFKRLAAGEPVRLASSRDGHLHRLLVRCAPAVDPPESVNVCHVEIGGKDDHEVIINAADMAAKADRAYDIQGVAAHTHALRLSAADFQKLARGEQVAITTSPATPGADHSHVIFIRYPAKK